jgi:hypothetical protein
MSQNGSYWLSIELYQDDSLLVIHGIDRFRLRKYPYCRPNLERIVIFINKWLDLCMQREFCPPNRFSFANRSLSRLCRFKSVS